MLEEGTAALNTAGNGILFDGATAWTFPNVAVGNAWTASVWIKLTGNGNGESAQFVTQLTGSTINLSMGYHDRSTNQICPAFYGSGAWKFGTTVSNSAYLNVWTYFQSTWDGTSLKFYINTNLKGTTQPGYPAIDNGQVYRIGRRWDDVDYIVGQIGEVRIYNYALSATDLSTDYTNTRATYGV